MLEVSASVLEATGLDLTGRKAEVAKHHVQRRPERGAQRNFAGHFEVEVLEGLDQAAEDSRRGIPQRPVDIEDDGIVRWVVVHVSRS